MPEVVDCYRITGEDCFFAETAPALDGRSRGDPRPLHRPRADDDVDRSFDARRRAASAARSLGALHAGAERSSWSRAPSDTGPPCVSRTSSMSSSSNERRASATSCLVMPSPASFREQADAVEDGVAEDDRLVRGQVQRALAWHPGVEHPDAGGQLVAGGVGPGAIEFAPGSAADPSVRRRPDRASLVAADDVVGAPHMPMDGDEDRGRTVSLDVTVERVPEAGGAARLRAAVDRSARGCRPRRARTTTRSGPPWPSLPRFEASSQDAAQTSARGEARSPRRSMP